LASFAALSKNASDEAFAVEHVPDELSVLLNPYGVTGPRHLHGNGHFIEKGDNRQK
jgi:hypothetical protein